MSISRRQVSLPATGAPVRQAPFFNRERSRWAKVVADANIQLD